MFGFYPPIGILSRDVDDLTNCAKSHEKCRCKHFGNFQILKTLTTDFPEAIGSGPNGFMPFIRPDKGYPRRTPVTMITRNNCPAESSSQLR